MVCMTQLQNRWASRKSNGVETELIMASLGLSLKIWLMQKTIRNYHLFSPSPAQWP